MNPSFHLTTGTFNLVVKDPIALRLSGAFRYPRTSPGLLESAPEQAPKPASHQAFRLLETNPIKLAQIAAFVNIAGVIPLITIISSNSLSSRQRTSASLLRRHKTRTGRKAQYSQLKDLIRSLNPSGFSVPECCPQDSIRLLGLAAACVVCSGHFP